MAFSDLYNDPQDVGQLVVAVQQAIVENFRESDWREFAYKTGNQDFILGHKRLLRSLSWSDDDYGDCVYQVLQRFSSNDAAAFEALVRHPKVHPQLERSASGILARIGLLHGHVEPVRTQALLAPEVVARALEDADALLRDNGPASCVDRLHTALHGYFKHICDSTGLQPPPSPSLTALFKLLRTDHPALANSGPHDQEVGRVLASFASAIDALNTLRNHASVAHPNEHLLGDAEARLMVNATRTIFHYVREKLPA